MPRLPSLLLLVLASLFAFAGGARGQERPKQPHVLVILADDLGWKDVGWHGSEIRTPHLDRLAGEGARLEQFYVQPVCSPTRAALLTGRYPMRYGMQSGVNRPWSTWGLPLYERTLSRALQDAGYVTAISGKWHLGHPAPEYLPTRRGFHRQYGHYTGAIDYFTHERDGGLDWHRDDRALREEGYSTDLIGSEAVRRIEQHDPSRPLFLYVAFNAPHTPLQAPKEYLDRYASIRNQRRRTYAAMVTCMDDAVGRIRNALEGRGMAGETLVIFSSDNGGPEPLGPNNGPLRAGKHTLYEGGVRVPAFARWPGVIRPGVVSQPLHMADWYPTVLKLAGAPAEPSLPLDGRDIWPVLTAGAQSPDEEILLNVEPSRGALRRGNWKLVVHELDRAEPRVELFNLADDPGEERNLAANEPTRTADLLDRLRAYGRQAAPPKGGERDRQPPGWQPPAVYGESR